MDPEWGGRSDRGLTDRELHDVGHKSKPTGF
jgi:hypothetical protein